MDLKYGEVYDLQIRDNDFKGVYLGEKIGWNRRGISKYVMLTNKPTILYHYTLFKFKSFQFKNSKLIPKCYYPVSIPENQRFFYENLLETKLK